MDGAFVVNVDRFTGRFAEELALSADKPHAILKTVEHTIDMYEQLRRAEADGDMTATVYLDAIDRAIKKTPLTKKQKIILTLLLEGYGVEKISKKLGTAKSSVVELRDRTYVALTKEYVKAPERIWKHTEESN